MEKDWLWAWARRKNGGSQVGGKIMAELEGSGGCAIGVIVAFLESPDAGSRDGTAGQVFTLPRHFGGV
jgi:hypothetical protein